ncbi:peptidoglycan-binding protein [Chromohalobacter sarecensis]|uniref:Peptidoglycan-binding protein n=1 Tax=Chromohalobacter sarecensis TaxID=245294 RepID=A0ABV9D1U0_9GAMM|nr:peptidoglycan-binding protein [Chromohalobacter sarecensis]MCK0715974.1 peptidoglycan-binding protein [Chromohalobacter sarecensis]
MWAGYGGNAAGWRRGGRLLGLGLVLVGVVGMVSVAEGRDEPQEVVHLSPRVREVPPSEAAPAIKRQTVAPFLNEYRFIDSRATLDDTPYVVAGEEGHQLIGSGDRVYVRAGEEAARSHDVQRVIYRPGTVYNDPQSDALLGIELRAVGEARWMKREGDLDVFEVRKARQEIRPGDRLLPYREDPLSLAFSPHVPEHAVDGEILGVPEGVHYIGRHTIVALDLGRTQGITPGTVLALDAAPTQVSDPLEGDTLHLAGEPGGLAMVFESFARVSYALVMEASRPLEVGDGVSTPERSALTSLEAQ